MRMRCLSLLTALFSLAAPASSSALGLAHGVVHEQDALGIQNSQDQASSVNSPEFAAEHNTLHDAPCGVSASGSSRTYATPPAQRIFFATQLKDDVRYPRVPLLDAAPPETLAARPRAPPLA